MTTPVRLSIIIPTYNSAATLERAILSVLNQTYPAAELIIIDGGSTDGTVEIVQRYAGRLAHWVSEKDSGTAEAFNKGLQAASGDLVGFLGADDFYLEGIFQHAAQAAEQAPQVDFFYGDLVYVGPVRPPFVARAPHTIRRSDFYLLPLCPLTAFVRRATILRLGGWNPRYKVSNDYEMVTRLAYGGARFQHLGRPVICMHWGGMSVAREAETAVEIRQAMRELGLPRWLGWRLSLALALGHLRLGLRQLPVFNMFFRLIYGVRNALFRVPAPEQPRTPGG